VNPKFFSSRRNPVEINLKVGAVVSKKKIIAIGPQIEVNKNQELWNKIVGQTNNQYLPAFYIKQDDTNRGPFFCPEKDFKNDDEAIELIKRYV